MTIWDATWLGIIQGLTEFLPISSSGHLVLAEYGLGVSDQSLVFEIAVHVGTLIAVTIYFRAQLVRLIRGVLAFGVTAEERDRARRMLLYLVIGSLPAVVVGLSLRHEIARIFGAPRLAAAFLIVTGVWLIAMRLRPTATRPLSAGKSWWIGCAQAAAILPGISRSGSTIATGTLLGLDGSEAAEFSFLLSIPAVLGATVLELPDALAAGQLHLSAVVGLIVAGVTGYVALSIVFATLRRGRFEWFGAYCILAGVVGVILL